MKEAVVRVGLEDQECAMRLDRAIDMFTRWRADATADVVEEQDTPGLMVKTAWGPDGALSKTLIFEEPKWAEFFMRIWTHGEVQSA